MQLRDPCQHLSGIVVDQQRHLHHRAQLSTNAAQRIEHGKKAVDLTGTARYERVEVANDTANDTVGGDFVFVPQDDLQRFGFEIFIVVDFKS